MKIHFIISESARIVKHNIIPVSLPQLIFLPARTRLSSACRGTRSCFPYRQAWSFNGLLIYPSLFLLYNEMKIYYNASSGRLPSRLQPSGRGATTEELLTACLFCAADLIYPEGQSIVTCVHCGRPNQRPVSEDEVLDLMKYADDERFRGNFDAAARSYDLVLCEHPDKHAALWGRLMCKYGVKVVEKIQNGIVVSRNLECHRARPTNLRSEADYPFFKVYPEK